MTDQEIGFAMGRKLPICAVWLGQTSYGFMGRFQAVHGLGKEPRQVANELFMAYCHNPATAKRMGKLAVSLFENSASWSDAGDRLRGGEALSIWDSTFTDRVKHAATHNGQIMWSPGVRGRVDKLLAKWSKHPSKSI